MNLAPDRGDQGWEQTIVRFSLWFSCANGFSGD